MLPLEGLKVIDFSERLPGPYCSGILADLGAEVIIVERAGTRPETRGVFPGLFELVNKNKKSMTLNMKSAEGKKIAGKIISQSDVLLEAFKPGVAERLGIGYGHVRGIKPSIIYCSISGFGQDGPYRDRVGHDINYLSLSGIMSIPGQPDTAPSRPGVPIVDLASGMFAAISIMAALMKRELTGKGERIDISMFDAMISWMSIRAGRYLVYGEKTGNDHLSALNNIYVTKDGKKISLGILEQHFWENFCKAVDREDLLNDLRFSSSDDRAKHSEALMSILKGIISEYTREELDRTIDWCQVPYAPVLTMEEAVNDLHVRDRNIFQEIEVGESDRIKVSPFPGKFSGFKTGIKSRPPDWGQHTGNILNDMGYSEKQIASLRDKKVI